MKIKTSISFLHLFVLFFCNFAFSQDQFLDSIRTIIKKDFEKVQVKDFKNLVPFDTQKGTGFLNSKNNKIVVPDNYYKLDFARPNIKGNGGNYFFEIDAVTKDVRVFYDESRLFEDSYSERNKMNGAEKGFVLDNNNRISSYSFIYKTEPYVFKFKNEYYGLVTTNQGKMVVKPNGDFPVNFDTVFAKLDMLNVADDIIWFKYQAKNGEQGLVNMNGEKKMINQISVESRSKLDDYFYFIDTDRSIKINYYGYSIERTDDSWGILDLVEMKWVIEPQKKFQIDQINYAVQKPLNKDFSISDRNNLKFYFLINNNDGSRPYFIDKKFKKYWP
jgi:hypothetical protein